MVFCPPLLAGPTLAITLAAGMEAEGKSVRKLEVLASGSGEVRRGEGKKLREGWASLPSSPGQGLQVDRPWGKMSKLCLGGR